MSKPSVQPLRQKQIAMSRRVLKLLETKAAKQPKQADVTDEVRQTLQTAGVINPPAERYPDPKLSPQGSTLKFPGA